MTLATIWYLVIILALICYAMLDGFDLGVGLLHLFVKEDKERRIFLNAIGPVWDGNEVWLVIVAGALFAGFPEVFASIFSAFYIPVIILLMGLMFRAVSIEFRSKHESKTWRKNWDVTFFLGSLVIAFGTGILLGNLIEGLALDSNYNYVGTFADFFHPYAIIVGITTIALFAMHGAMFLVMKTEGELQNKVKKFIPRTIFFFIAMYAIVTIWSLIEKPFMISHMKDYPILFLIPFASFTAIALIFYFTKKRREGWAFICSCASIAFLLSLAAIGTFPYMVRSTVDPQTNSLLISNASSSPLTLKVLLTIAGIGLPLVLAYGFYVYHVFRGKVEIDVHSY